MANNRCSHIIIAIHFLVLRQSEGSQCIATLDADSAHDRADSAGTVPLGRLPAYLSMRCRPIMLSWSSDRYLDRAAACHVKDKHAGHTSNRTRHAQREYLPFFLPLEALRSLLSDYWVAL